MKSVSPALRILILIIFGLAVELLAQEPAAEEGRSRFCAVDIFLDSGSTPLAAYQIHFAVTNRLDRIVAIEGGEHAAFRRPPFYDPKAIQHEVAVLAAFSTASPSDLPTGKTRVATIHLRTSGTGSAQFQLQVQAAADAQGNKISCLATFQPRTTQ